MGTRADFYIGRGKDAEWIGSIAWDGYPAGNPKPLLQITDENEFRAKVAEIIAGDDVSGTKPDQGWPWAWNDSRTTNYSYALDESRVWGTCFGRGWWPADHEPEESCDENTAKVEFPDFSSRGVLAHGHRSGFRVMPMRRPPRNVVGPHSIRSRTD